MELLLEHYFRNTQESMFWRKWKWYVVVMKTLNKMPRLSVKDSPKLECKITSHQRIFGILYKEKCFYSYYTCMYTCLSMFRNKSQFYLNVFLENKLSELYNLLTLQIKQSHIKYVMKEAMTLKFLVRKNSEYNQRKFTNFKSNLFQE